MEVKHFGTKIEGSSYYILTHDEMQSIMQMAEEYHRLKNKEKEFLEQGVQSIEAAF